MRDKAAVLIVGGGVIGCAVARELAGRGVAVTLLERAEPGHEASGAAAGLLSPQSDCRQSGPFFELARESRDLYPDWVAALEAETGESVDYRRTGVLRCAFGEEEAKALEGFLWQRAAGYPVEWREAEELSQEFGEWLSPAVRKALFFPMEAAVNSRLLTKAVEVSAKRHGARILTGRRALRFRIQGGRCGGVETEEGSLEAESVVNAAGAWAAFDPSLPIALPVEPVRGQMIELEVSGSLPSTVIHSEEVYLVPRKGSLLVGATVEHVGFDKEVTAGAVESLTAAAARLCPGLRSARLARAWAGLRPGTPDGLPLLGRSPVPGLFLATGHFRSGILLAPITARILADEVLGVGLRDLTPFSVERFINRPEASDRRSRLLGTC